MVTQFVRTGPEIKADDREVIQRGCVLDHGRARLSEPRQGVLQAVEGDFLRAGVQIADCRDTLLSSSSPKITAARLSLSARFRRLPVLPLKPIQSSSRGGADLEPGQARRSAGAPKDMAIQPAAACPPVTWLSADPGGPADARCHGPPMVAIKLP